MSAPNPIRSPLMAITQEILPVFGLAFLVDDNDTTWAITKSTDGPGLNALHTGQRVKLMIDDHPHFRVVRAYDPQS